MDENKNSIRSVFLARKQGLLDNLKGLSLPKDSLIIEKTLTDFLNSLFANEGTFRQTLTESEDYILLSVLRLLQSQQDIAKEIANSISDSNDVNASPIGNKENGNILSPYTAVVGAAVGAVAGGLVNTWAGIAGAIAGTAVVVYIASKQNSSRAKTQNTASKTSETNLDTNVFLTIVESICDNIDNVIKTFRIQIKRVEKIYNQRQYPTLTTDYAVLLEHIENVYKYSSVEGVPSKLKNAVDMLVECLENYDLKIENGKIISEQ